ncbi:hypothetical protein M9194_00040 [Vibrio sp. S4M6]|uniref:hypothetical protein n=1 Tax=Vibrio sinus TaxID=2946865 RepID=UPI00202A046F|nr:hypothetical protein [Vibrio sinus]MCL9779820.1 hypothetical protein [Vibrio sinus]
MNLKQLIKQGSTIVALVTSLFSSMSYSNTLVFFGDSLSDTGNYPEPENVTLPQLKNFNLYVPVTNPVPEKLYGTAGYPSVDFLKKSIPHQGLINGEPKPLYSINWPMYLASDKGQPSIVTWFNYITNGGKRKVSLNYAWASAIASGKSGCYHDNGDIFSGDCNESTILDNRVKYIQNTESNSNYDKQNGFKYSDLQIPNLAKQVDLYFEDTNQSQRRDANIFIYIGGNDISNLLRSKLIRLVLEPRGVFNKLIDREMVLLADNILRTVARIRVQDPTAHIYVLTLPNFTYLHAGHSYQSIPIIGGKVSDVLAYTISQFNDNLKQKLSGLTNVKVIDSGAYLNSLARQKTYAKSVLSGSTCINSSSGVYESAASQNSNCYYGKHHTSSYYSWNNAHYVSSVNQKLADYVLMNM